MDRESVKSARNIQPAGLILSTRGRRPARLNSGSLIRRGAHPYRRLVNSVPHQLHKVFYKAEHPVPDIKNHGSSDERRDFVALRLALQFAGPEHRYDVGAGAIAMGKANFSGLEA